MPKASTAILKPSRALRKLRPELASVDTLELLEKAAAEAVRLRAENKRLASELSAAKKRVAALEKRVKPAAKRVEVATEPVEKKPAAPKRQALGAGLARFLK